MTKRTSEPRHTHLCDSCRDCMWLGRDGMFDLYACTSLERGVVLIARYGNRPNDYASLSLRNHSKDPDTLSEPFRVAWVRARNAGVIE